MTQSDAGVASLTPTKITPAELDAFSAAQVQGSFQQTSQMAAMGAFNGPVDYVGAHFLDLPKRLHKDWLLFLKNTFQWQ